VSSDAQANVQQHVGNLAGSIQLVLADGICSTILEGPHFMLPHLRVPVKSCEESIRRPVRGV
jgi:hypothetical protein